MDEQGFVKIVGRTKEMLIKGGENIYPREVEEMLKLVQKQISDVSQTVTRALTGGLDLKGTTAEEMNKNVVDPSQPVMSTIPFIKEFEEYLELFQKQINRLGGTVQRVIQGGQTGSGGSN